MIEDKETGIKFAEDADEVLWTTMLDNSTRRIREMKAALEIEEVVGEYLKSKASK